MDFVTITDHDTIDGVLQIAERPDVFVSEELTAHFRGEPQAVHVLCYGISPEDHEWLQAHRGDVELCAAYMYEREIACALAHPYYTVAAPLTARHRRRLAELFAVWEVRNGARARELNRPAATYVATRDGIGIGGSDDHAGVDIGRTWTEAPAGARRPREFLAHVRAGRGARGERRAAPPSGRTPRSRWPCASLRPRRRESGRRGVRPGARARDGRATAARGRRARGLGGGPASPDDARCAAARVAARGRARRSRRARSDRLHAGRATSATPTSTGAPAARTSAGWPARSRWRCAAAHGEVDSDAARRRAVRRLHRGDPLRAGRPRSSPTSTPSCARARRAAAAGAQARATATRRGSRSSPTASARRTASRARSRRSASAACPGFEIEVRRHRPRGRPAPVRGRRDRRARSTPACGSACRACRRPCRRSPTAASTLIHVCSPGPAGHRGALVARALGRAARRQLPHRAGRLRRPALAASSGSPRR